MPVTYSSRLACSSRERTVGIDQRSWPSTTFPSQAHHNLQIHRSQQRKAFPAADACLELNQQGACCRAPASVAALHHKIHGTHIARGCLPLDRFNGKQFDEDVVGCGVHERLFKSSGVVGWNQDQIVSALENSPGVCCTCSCMRDICAGSIGATVEPFDGHDLMAFPACFPPGCVMILAFTSAMRRLTVTDSEPLFMQINLSNGHQPRVCPSS